MQPSLFIVFDRSTGRACRAVQGMLGELDAQQNLHAGQLVAAARGEGWAMALVPPPTAEVTCGASIAEIDGDVLAWTGELFMPEGAGDCSRRTPKERGFVLLERLRRDGIESLADVDGTFCGVWYDKPSRRWTIFNDKLGLLPLFWWHKQDRLIVSPRAWLTWRGSGQPLRISDAGVVDMIRCENAVDDHTLINGVHWLPGGHALVRDPKGRSRTRMYWEFQHKPVEPIDLAERIDIAADVLQTSIRRQSSCDAPLMLGISGGMDSRGYLAACVAEGRIPHCYTTGTPVLDDVRFGRELARIAGAVHDDVSFQPKRAAEALESLIVDTDGLHSARHLVAGYAVGGYLAGHCGSVLLEGYLQGGLSGTKVANEQDVLKDCAPHATRWARYHMHGGGDPAWVNNLLRPGLAEISYDAWQARVDEKYGRALAEDPLRKAEYVVLSGRSGRNDVLGTLTLRHDVHVRCPTGDRALLDWYAGMPPNLMAGKRFHMDLFRRRYPEFARVQRSDYSSMPIGADRWRREYCWQKEKLWRRWVRLRYPWTRRWGTAWSGLQAWTFDEWRRSGRLDSLAGGDARVCNWVRRVELLDCWNRLERDPLQCNRLFGLATIEIMVRWLEDRAGRRFLNDRQASSIAFEELPVAAKTHGREIEMESEPIELVGSVE